TKRDTCPPTNATHSRAECSFIRNLTRTGASLLRHGSYRTHSIESVLPHNGVGLRLCGVEVQLCGKRAGCRFGIGKCLVRVAYPWLRRTLLSRFDCWSRVGTCRRCARERPSGCNWKKRVFLAAPR